MPRRPEAPPRAVVIGAGGQDGSYLCELLVERGYEVLACVRSGSASRHNLDVVRGLIEVWDVDLLDFPRVERVLREFEPAEVYNFAAPSFGPDAWKDPVGTAQTGAVAVGALLETLRATMPQTRIFQASSAWVFGRPETTPQDEATPYAPIEPYGAAKAHADFLVRSYRASHEVFACSGILYNHESPRRLDRFVTRKITSAVAEIKLGLRDELVLGDLEAQRDWGYAKDFVAAAWAALQADEPHDYVIATGEAHSVRQFVERAFDAVGLNWQEHVRSDPKLHRGAREFVMLVGDARRAREQLGWSPSVSFDELVELMVRADLDRLSGRSARTPSSQCP